MNATIRLLLVPYRDLLIDELAVLASRKTLVYPPGVKELLEAAVRERAGSKAPRHGFRGFLKTLGVAWPPDAWVHRFDDSVEPSDLFLLESTLVHQLDSEAELVLRLVTLRELLASLLTPDSYAGLEQHLLPLPRIDRRTTGAEAVQSPANEQKGGVAPSSNQQLIELPGEQIVQPPATLREAEDAASSRKQWIELLRAEAVALSSRLYRRIGGLPAVEEIRTGVAGAICGCALLILSISSVVEVMGFLSQRTLPLPPSNTLPMACWGAVGATVSTIERLYRVDALHEPLKTALTLSAGKFPLMLTPLIGFIFALVLYLLFRGDFLSGVLFPKVRCADWLSWVLVNISTANQCANADPYVELGKLLGWGFLAGWAERMVPDVLDKLAPQTSGGIKLPSKPH